MSLAGPVQVACLRLATSMAGKFPGQRKEARGPVMSGNYRDFTLPPVMSGKKGSPGVRRLARGRAEAMETSLPHCDMRAPSRGPESVWEPTTGLGRPIGNINYSRRPPGRATSWSVYWSEGGWGQPGVPLPDRRVHFFRFPAFFFIKAVETGALQQDTRNAILKRVELSAFGQKNFPQRTRGYSF